MQEAVGGYVMRSARITQSLICKAYLRGGIICGCLATGRGADEYIYISSAPLLSPSLSLSHTHAHIYPHMANAEQIPSSGFECGQPLATTRTTCYRPCKEAELAAPEDGLKGTWRDMWDFRDFSVVEVWMAALIELWGENIYIYMLYITIPPFTHLTPLDR